MKPLALLIAALSVAAVTAQSTPRTETVTGEVIDLACYARNKATGMNHDRSLECAYACVRWEGQPVGLLTREGKVYQLAGGLVANSNIKIAPHLAKSVTVTGQVSEVDGLLTLSSNEVAPAK